MDIGEPLWRHVLGDELRRRRHDRDETLAETAGRAGVSPQYLSEVERGRKEPSSEMIAALAGAFGLSLAELTRSVADSLAARSVADSLAGQPHRRGPRCRAEYALAA